MEQPEDPHESLTVLSFNIWFGQHRRQSRLLALVRLLQVEVPDCVCLQEMTPPVLRELLRHEFIREHYCCSTTVEEFEELASGVNYDVVMLCRPWLATGELSRFRLTSRFGRTFLVCNTTINGNCFMVASVVACFPHARAWQVCHWRWARCIWRALRPW